MPDSNRKTIVIAASEPDGKTFLKVHALADELAKQGHIVLKARTADDALELCLNAKPDMLIASDSLTEKTPEDSEHSAASLMESITQARMGDMSSPLTARLIQKDGRPSEAGIAQALQESLSNTALLYWEEDRLPEWAYDLEHMKPGGMRRQNIQLLYSADTLEKGVELAGNALKTIVLAGYDGHLQAVLMHQGYCVLTASSATDALRLCNQYGADLLVTGNEPSGSAGMSGFDLIRQAQKDGIPALYLTRERDVAAARGIGDKIRVLGAGTGESIPAERLLHEVKDMLRDKAVGPAMG